MPALFDFDFGLALQRVTRELRDQPRTGRAFVANPFEAELVEAHREEWLRDLKCRVESGRWSPGPIEICDAPKGGNLVRPAARLGIEDRVVYTAAVGACLPNIFTATRWSQGTCDFATRLNSSKLDTTEWMRNPFRGWKEFVDRSVYRCQTHPVVVVADIAGYFENISMNLLASDLRRIGSPSPAIKLSIYRRGARCRHDGGRRVPTDVRHR